MNIRAVKPNMSYEYFMWIFTRLSGAAIILLAALGMTGAFLLGARTQVDLPTLMRWSFFPNPNHVVNSDIPDVALGWANGFWQIMQLLIVFLGATHGFNGLRCVVEDFTGSKRSWLFVGAMAGLSGMGIYLGRVLRWNSWDVFLYPRAILVDAAHLLIHPFSHLSAIGMMGLFAGLLFVSYWMFTSLQRAKSVRS